MYDIDFFRKSSDLKRKITSMELTEESVSEIEKELDHLRNKSPHIYNIENNKLL